MNFQMIFSGPCAYIPNRLAGGEEPEGSWSALFLDTSLGLTVEEVEIAPHYTVLQLPIDLFDLPENVNNLEILRFQKDEGPSFAAIRLAGHRLRIETGNPTEIDPVLTALPPEVLEDPESATPEQRLSLKWLPTMENLLQGSGAVGTEDEPLFDGPLLPVEGNVAAHVILDQGRLVTHSLLPERAPENERPSIWGFRASPDQDPVATQAVAHTVALRIDPLTRPLRIHLTRGDEHIVIALKDTVQDDLVTVEVKNREMDEIVQFAQAEISEGAVDRDFKTLYKFSGLQQQSCPLPFLSRAGGVGSLRTTCGGALFAGFSQVLSAPLSDFLAVGGGEGQ